MPWVRPIRWWILRSLGGGGGGVADKCISAADKSSDSLVSDGGTREIWRPPWLAPVSLAKAWRGLLNTFLARARAAKWPGQPEGARHTNKRTGGRHTKGPITIQIVADAHKHILAPIDIGAR